MADDYAGDTSTTGYLPIFGQAAGRIDGPGDEDWLRIGLTPGGAYLFDARAADGSKLRINVWDDARQYVMYGNEPGGLYTYPLSTPFGWVEPGQYFIRIASDHATAYTVGVRQLDDDHANIASAAQTLAAGGTARARIEYAGDLDYFHVAAVPGYTYTVTLHADSGAPPAGLALRDSAYNIVPAGADGTTFSFSATYGPKDFYFAAGIRPEDTLAGAVPIHVALAVEDTAAPTVMSAAGTIDGLLTLTFSEPVRRGSGTIELFDRDGAVLRTWDVAQASVDGATVAVDPGRLLLPGQYGLRIAGGAVTDLAGHPLGTASVSTPLFIDTTSGGGRASKVDPYSREAYGNLNGSDDVVVLPGKMSDYTVANSPATGTARVTGPDGVATLKYVERILFTDSPQAIALSLEGHVGRAYRLYQAAFDRAPDPDGMGYYVYHQEHGLALEAMANNFLNSPEFIARYGANTSDAVFVDSLYRNVLHRAGDVAGLAYHVANLEHGMSRAAVLTGFSESPENQAQVAQLVGDGFVYTPLA